MASFSQKNTFLGNEKWLHVYCKICTISFMKSSDINVKQIIRILFGLVRFMVINATSKNISVLSWRSVLLVKETGIPGEKHRPAASHWQALSHNVVLSTHYYGFELTTFNNISAIPWRSVLLTGEAKYPEKTTGLT